jgi:hypothetical protein
LVVGGLGGTGSYQIRAETVATHIHPTTNRPINQSPYQPPPMKPTHKTHAPGLNVGDAPYMAFSPSSSPCPFSSPVTGSTTAAECAPPALMSRTRAPVFCSFVFVIGGGFVGVVGVLMEFGGGGEGGAVLSPFDRGRKTFIYTHAYICIYTIHGRQAAIAAAAPQLRTHARTHARTRHHERPHELGAEGICGDGLLVLLLRGAAAHVPEPAEVACIYVYNVCIYSVCVCLCVCTCVFVCVCVCLFCFILGVDRALAGRSRLCICIMYNLCIHSVFACFFALSSCSVLLFFFALNVDRSVERVAGRWVY